MAKLKKTTDTKKTVFFIRVISWYKTRTNLLISIKRFVKLFSTGNYFFEWVYKSMS